MGKKKAADDTSMLSLEIPPDLLPSAADELRRSALKILCRGVYTIPADLDVARALGTMVGATDDAPDGDFVQYEAARPSM